MKSLIRIAVFSLLVIFLMAAVFALQQEDRLAQIRFAIKDKGANWIAGETWVSRLSQNERRNLLGLRLDESEVIQEVPLQPLILREGVPAAIDWRNKDGYNWVTPAKEQSGCPACVAFAVCGALESLIRIELSDPSRRVDASEWHLFQNGGGTCEQGWNPGDALQYLNLNGTPDENCWPYLQPGQTCPNSEMRVAKISAYGRVWGAEAMMNYVAIAPIIAGMDVFEDFLYYESGIYEHLTGYEVGWHLVLIIGYDISGEVPYWICKNSWLKNPDDEPWGENGFFKIKMGECLIESLSSYWMSGAVPPIPPSVAPSNIAATPNSWLDLILSWDDNSDNEGGFEIYSKRYEDPDYTFLGEVNEYTHYFHDGLFIGDYSYLYKVNAVNLGGGIFNTTSFTIIPLPINAPSGLTGYYDYEIGAVRLTWTEYSNNEEGFAIERRPAYSTIWQEIERVMTPVTTYNDTDVDPDNLYYYRVRAYNPAGYSAYSNTKKVWVNIK